MFQKSKQYNRSKNQQDEWSKPEQISRRLYRRIIQNKITVTLGQVRNDFFIRLAGFDLLANLFAQILCEIGARIGERFILANQTAQLFGQIFHPRFDLRIFVGLRFFGERRC